MLFCRNFCGIDWMKHNPGGLKSDFDMYFKGLSDEEWRVRKPNYALWYALFMQCFVHSLGETWSLKPSSSLKPRLWVCPNNKISFLTDLDYRNPSLQTRPSQNPPNGTNLVELLELREQEGTNGRVYIIVYLTIS